MSERDKEGFSPPSHPLPLFSSDRRCVPLTTPTTSLKTSDGGWAYKVRLSILLIFLILSTNNKCQNTTRGSPLLCAVHLSFQATGGVCHSPRPLHPSKRVTEDEGIRYARRSSFILYLLTYQSQNAARRDYSLLRIFVFAQHNPSTACFEQQEVFKPISTSTSRFKLRDVHEPTTTIPSHEMSTGGPFAPSSTSSLPVSSNGRFSSSPPHLIPRNRHRWAFCAHRNLSTSRFE